MTLMTREYEPVHLWQPAPRLTMAEVCRQLLRDTRGMSPFERAVFIRTHTGIRPRLMFDGDGAGMAVLSLTHYPHLHMLRPRRSGWFCPCEATSREDCHHICQVDLECAENGEPVEITAARLAA